MSAFAKKYAKGLAAVAVLLALLAKQAATGVFDPYGDVVAFLGALGVVNIPNPNTK